MVQNVPLKLLEIQGKDNKTAKGADGFSSLQNQANQTAQLDWNISKEMPSEYDGDIQWAQMAKQNMADLKKKSPWETAFNSIFSGIEHFAQSGKNKKIMENANKIKSVLSYFSDMNEKLAERRQQYEIRDMAIKQLAPSIKEYLTISRDISPQNKVNFVRSQLKLWNQLTGDDLELDGLDGLDDSKIFVSSKNKGLSSINLIDLIPEFKQKQDANTLEQMAKDEGERLRRIEERRLNVDQARVDAYNRDINNRWNPESQYDKEFGITQGKEEAKRIGELEDQNLHLEDKKWQIKELQDMLKGNKVITGQTIGSWLSRATGKQFNTEAMSETEAFDALSKNLLGFVKGDVKFGNMNQKEFEWLAKQTPDSTMTKGGIERILNRLDSSIDRAMKRNDQEMRRRPSYNRHDTNPLTSQGTGDTTGAENGGGTTIVLYDPETETEVTKTVPDLNQAIAQAKKLKLQVRI